MTYFWSTINLDFNYFFPGILEPFLKDVILERLSMRQSLGLVQKVKPFKIFTAIHDYKILFAVKIELSINSHFLTTYVLKFKILH